VKGAAGAGVDQALIAHVAQQRLERDLVLCREAERLGDLALSGRLVGALDEVEDLLARRQAGAVLGHGALALQASRRFRKLNARPERSRGALLRR
jgi:hypothetical protein